MVRSLPILSVPRVRTSRKQNGKSRMLKPRYIPTAAQPYSLESFFSLPLSDVSAAFVEPPEDQRVFEEWNDRLGVRKATRAWLYFRNPLGFPNRCAQSCETFAAPILWCHGTGPCRALVDTLRAPNCLVASLLTMLLAPRAPTRASNAPNAPRIMMVLIACVRFPSQISFTEPPIESSTRRG